MPEPPVPAPHGMRAGDRPEDGGSGLMLVGRLHALLRASRMYQQTNQAFQQLVQELIEIVDGCAEDESLLIAIGGFFYFNGTRLRPSPSLLASYNTVMGSLEQRGLAGLRLMRGLGAVEVDTFLHLFLTTRDAAAGENLPDQVAQTGIRHIVPIRIKDLPDTPDELGDDPDSPELKSADRAQRSYWQAVSGVRRILQSAARTGRPALREARRAVQPIVDNILREEFSIVGLTAIKDHDIYTYAHCVNVSVLSVGMGYVVGLSRESLANLGVAALLHDVGKIAVSPEILRKAGALTSNEWTQMKRHPLEGVKMLTRMPGSSRLAHDAMQVCLEHHLKHDGRGYPTIDRPWSVAPLSRLVAVADCFDAVTAHRSYQARPFTSFEALGCLLGAERDQFDPVALWALVKTVGVYPAGTVLRLESGHLALSLSPNPDDPWRPRCRVLARPDGTRPRDDEPEVWDELPESGRVARVLAPEEYPFEVGTLLA